MSAHRFVIIDVRVAEQPAPGQPPRVRLHTVYTGATRPGEDRDRTVGAAIDHVRDTLELADEQLGGDE